MLILYLSCDSTDIPVTCFVVDVNRKENACGEISDLSQMQSFPFEDILLKKEATKMQMYQMKLYYLCCKNLMMKHEDIIWFPLCWNSSKGYMVRISFVIIRSRCLSKTNLSQKLTVFLPVVVLEPQFLIIFFRSFISFCFQLHSHC